jgi:hypothetical protein
VFLLSGEMITDDNLHAIASAIQPPELTAIETDPNRIAVNSDTEVHQPELLMGEDSEQLTAILNSDKIAVNHRDYIGCISPKQIKGNTYWYWVYRERGKRRYKCMGSDRAQAIAKAKAIGDPRKKVRG